jgi:hypothetical protein
MLEREARNKYLLELGAAMALYTAVLVGSIYMAKTMQPGLARTLVVITPSIQWRCSSGSSHGNSGAWMNSSACAPWKAWPSAAPSSARSR